METNNDAFKIAIFHENSAAATRARELAGRLAETVEAEWNTWSFEMMDRPAMRELAAEIAARANMVMLAPGPQNGLPESMERWLECWLPKQKFSPSVLVALLDEKTKNGNQSLRLCVYLSDLARRANMDFICNLDAWRPTVQIKHERPVFDPSIPVWLPDRAPEYSATRGWGIND